MDKLNKSGLKMFNDTYNRFLRDVSKSFPDVSETIRNNYFDKKDTKPIHYYLKHYMYEIYPHMERIAECDEKLFSEGEEPLGLLEGVNFRFIWKKADKHIRSDIWKYLHTLHLLSSFNGNIDILIENNNNNLTKFKLLENVKRVQNNYKSIKEKINKYLTDALSEEFKNGKNDSRDSDSDGDDDNDGNNEGMLGSLFGSSLNIGDTLKSLMEKINDEDSEMFRLMSDVMEGINLEESEELVKNPMDMLNMMMGKGGNSENANKITETLNDVVGKMLTKIQEKDIDMDKLKNEAEDLVGDFMGSMKNSDNFIGKMMSNPNFMDKITKTMNNSKIMESMTDMMSKLTNENSNAHGENTGLENLLGGVDGNNLLLMAQQMAQQNPELVNMARQAQNPHSNMAAQEKMRRTMEAKHKRQIEDQMKQSKATPIEQDERSIDELVREIEGNSDALSKNSGTKKIHRKKANRKYHH